jgi:hypothetical protein
MDLSQQPKLLDQESHFGQDIFDRRNASRRDGSAPDYFDRFARHVWSGKKGLELVSAVPSPSQERERALTV